MIVVDASVLANALGDGHEAGDAARAALSGMQLAAPDLVDWETLSVLRKRWLTGDLNDEEIAESVDALCDLELERYPARPMLSRALELRHNLSPYDAAYVALAELLDCPLVTADARLVNAPGSQCEFRFVVTIG